MNDFSKKSIKKLGGMSFIIIGAFLVLEHIYTYGEISFFDILGHEWLGIILFIVGCLITFNYKYYNPFKYAKEKIYGK